MQVAFKLKSAAKDPIQKEVWLKITFLPFISRNFRLTTKPLKLKIIPYNQEQCKLKHDALYLFLVQYICLISLLLLSAIFPQFYRF